MTIRVHFTTKFPSVSHPVYCEVRNEDTNSFGYGHVEYWDAFHNVDEMKDFLCKLYKGDKVVFVGMKA